MKTQTPNIGLQADDLIQADGVSEDDCECFLSFSEPAPSNFPNNGRFTIGDATGLSLNDQRPGTTLFKDLSGDLKVFTGTYFQGFPAVFSGATVPFPDQSSFIINPNNLHYDIFGDSYSCFEMSSYGPGFEIGLVLSIPIRIECYLDEVLMTSQNRTIEFAVGEQGSDTQDICVKNVGCIDNLSE